MKTLTTLVKIVALLFIVAAMIVDGIYLRRENAKLRIRAGELRHRNETVVHLTEENQRTREFLTQTKSDAAEAAQALHADVLHMRADVSDLEERAHVVFAQKSAAAAELAASRDPEKAMTRLENFQNVGRTTPASAVQTLIWAAVKNDEPTLAGIFFVTGDAKEKIEALFARLPSSAREKYPTLQSVASLLVSQEILRVDAAQIISTTQLGSDHAFVTVRGGGSDDEAKVPMELGPDGWRVLVPGKLVTLLEKRLAPPPSTPPPKK